MKSITPKAQTHRRAWLLIKLISDTLQLDHNRLTTESKETDPYLLGAKRGLTGVLSIYS